MQRLTLVKQPQIFNYRKKFGKKLSQFGFIMDLNRKTAQPLITGKSFGKTVQFGLIMDLNRKTAPGLFSLSWLDPI